MADKDLVSMTQQFSGLPMDSLIGGPLNAAATANSSMAITQTKFMLDTCFEKIELPNQDNVDENNKKYNYKPIMIAMSLDRGVIEPGNNNGDQATIQNVETSFNLPLLTIIPINSLGVDEVGIDFEMEVKSSFSDEQTDTKENQIKTSGSFEAKVGYGPFSASVKGSASYDHKDSTTHSTHYQKSNSAKYTVKVHAGQLPVPKGVNTIIEAFSKSIEPITLPKGDPQPVEALPA